MLLVLFNLKFYWILKKYQNLNKSLYDFKK